MNKKTEDFMIRAFVGLLTGDIGRYIGDNKPKPKTRKPKKIAPKISKPQNKDITYTDYEEVK